ncbi:MULTISPECIES: GreA/GreB family elongation factor [unclassified Devosia]|uniref:GreA/GreB family elongation factor n=1 Tax=unclassified Devosia TaxID=196773 RepID=UPI00145D0F7A|nr:MULTISPECIES: GreA/GreB family elongation factor [unclassified Devosia]MBJ6986871.1 GreA/GreB family elongation factor [Devosia sp. MC521]QMW63901.1 GreA/GreB family elongation factor [Devosia sp. MC521]
MTTISLSDWMPSPELLIGEQDHKRLTVAALTEVGQTAERMDFLLYELDRASIIADAFLPRDVVRIGSLVKYVLLPGEERCAKLVMPEEAQLGGTYRLSVTSAEGAALLGLRPGHVMSWVEGADQAVRRIKVLSVSNPDTTDTDPSGPTAA